MGWEKDDCDRAIPKASPPQWGGGPLAVVGHPPVTAVCRRKPFGQGSATAMWARVAVLVCKANRQKLRPDMGRRYSMEGPV